MRPLPETLAAAKKAYAIIGDHNVIRRLRNELGTEQLSTAILYDYSLMQELKKGLTTPEFSVKSFAEKEGVSDGKIYHRIKKLLRIRHKEQKEPENGQI